ncbi:MAG TPA: D-2-hydroxyacid dehydrogenase [Thermomicrobiales bacterium]|jgi:phosphoglycerate dehydrogenase-like enzyme|nr:D-2-hydroxyacid dehydrogenase [Thermomicrobiales bacterium]
MSAVSSPLAIQKVVIGNDLWPNAVQSVKDRFPDLDIVLETDSKKIDQHLGDADAYTGFRLSSEQLDAAGQLKWVHALSAGVEHWIGAGIADRDILLTNSSGVHATNISEHVFAMLLSFARQLPALQRSQDKRQWRDNENFREAIFEVAGQSMAIVGTGAIGTAVATRAKAFGMTTVGVRRNADSPAPEGIDDQITFGDLKGRLGDIDHVVICLPMTDDTAGLFDADMLAAMKPGSYFFNIGRGGIVDQDALIQHLHAGHIAGAGLDVATPEPLPADSPLWDAPNTIITAHTSGNTPKYGERALKLFGDNLQALIDGREPENVVDVSAGY